VLKIPELRGGVAAKIRPANPGIVSIAGSGEEMQSPASTAAMARVPVPEASKWRWKIFPLLTVHHTLAAQRSVFETTIALPPCCEFNAPIIRDADGVELSCAWTFAGDGEGLRIRIPATNRPPFSVTLGNPPQSDPPAFDDLSVGLLVESVPGPDWVLNQASRFVGYFNNTSAISSARVEKLDHLMNPAGSNSRFIARYRGPLFVPATGKYTMAFSVDDGGVLSVDGQVVISRLGRHDSGLAGRPDTWGDRKVVDLVEGVHWIACYQQEIGGRQAAQVAWKMPELARGSWQRDFFMDPVDTAAPDIDIAGSYALSGLIPCAVEIQHNGQSVLAITPCRGLQLRKPGRLIHASAFRKGAWKPENNRTIIWNTAPGRRTLRIDDGDMPVWVESSSFRKFSIEWDQCVVMDEQCIRLRTFDIAMPLRLKTPTFEGHTALYNRRNWQTARLTPADISGKFSIFFEDIELDGGTVKPWMYVDDNPTNLTQISSCARLVRPGSVKAPFSLPADKLRPWFAGATKGEVVPDFLQFNTWGDNTNMMSSIFAGAGDGPIGVALLLNYEPLRLGLGSDEFAAKLDTHIRDILKAGAMPVLVIDASVNLENPIMCSFALFMVRMQSKYGCPLVDMRAKGE
jgi:hypothetical protein